MIDAREREILELRSHLNDLMASYDEIVSNKSSLEFEINTYRRLLESEEGRIRETKHTIKTTTHISSTSSQQQQHHHHSQQQIIRHPSPPPPPQPVQTNKTLINEKLINQTEMQAKTTFQRSAKGPPSLPFVLRRSASSRFV